MSEAVRGMTFAARGTRYTTRVVQRARELARAGWTAGAIRRILAREFALPRPPSDNTIRAWTEGYRQQRDQRDQRRPEPEPTADLLLALRLEDGLSHTAIAAVIRRFFGQPFTESQVRYRLDALGAPKNHNKARPRQEAAA